MKKATMLASVLALSGLAGLSFAATQTGPGQGQQGAASTLTKQGTEFFENAAIGNMLEVKLGQLAEKQANDESVRKFGQRMVDDHGKLNAELSQIAHQKKGLVMPQQLDKKHQQTLDKLAKESGKQFDQSYMSMMVDEHQKDISAFEKEAKDGKDADLKQFAANALPTLQDHLAQAKEIESRIKK